MIAIPRLDGTQVTDTGLTHLKGLANLEDLGVPGTRVTSAGEAGLKRNLPKLKIGQ